MSELVNYLQFQQALFDQNLSKALKLAQELELRMLAIYLKQKFPRTKHSINNLVDIIKQEYNIK